MRINLNCPYSEKDKAKALGARWDASRRVWYISGVEDLSPFLRWLPKGREKLQEELEERLVVKKCGCVTLPWDDCVHTQEFMDRMALAHLRDIMAGE